MTELTWAVTRATAITSIVLLTATVVLGCLTTAQAGPGHRQRSVQSAIHRTLSLVMVCFITVHVVTAVLDTYVDISWLSALVPFVAGYRAFWTGLGTLGVDILIVITVTSLLRHRLPVKGWKAIHYSAYALWPVSLLHGVFSASVNVRLTVWVSVACAVAGLAAIVYRVLVVPADTRRRQLFTDRRAAPSPAPAHRHPAAS